MSAEPAPLIDTVREVYTPEGVALRLPAAGPWLRSLAWSIDATIRVAVLMISMPILGFLGNTGMGIYLICVFVLLWLYPVLFEVLNNGQTPGKRALNLRTVRADGGPVGWQESFVRNLLRAVDMLPVGYAVGLVCSLLDPAGRRLGDLVADTLVVHVQTRTLPATATATHPPNLPSAVPLPALRLDEQAAVVGFGERAALLTRERRLELAGLAGELVSGAPEQQVEQLHAAASHLLGR